MAIRVTARIREWPLLGVLGISEFDERVYRVFLTGPATPMPDVAAAVDAPVSRVRHAVSRLESLGLIKRVGHGHYTPEGPHTALIGLLNQRRVETEQAFDEVRGAVDELSDEYRAGRLRTDPADLVEVVSGAPMVRRRLDELTSEITTQLLVLDRPASLDAIERSDTSENGQELAATKALLERGVEVRTVYSPESMERPGRFDIVNRLAGLGEQSRMTQRLPLRLRVMDRFVAVLPLLGNNNDTIAVVHPCGLLDALIELFEAYWARATPITAPPADASDQPSDEDLLLLRMLQAGLKDHAVARQLGVSERTATRRIATIMSRLGTETRFQAGVEAAKRGWL